MTREEQIIEAGAYHLCGLIPPKTCGHNMYELAYISRDSSFEAGAKWADEHPKPGTVNKQEFIEKACEWLRKNTTWECNFYGGNNPNKNKIEDFRKAMEE